MDALKLAYRRTWKLTRAQRDGGTLTNKFRETVYTLYSSVYAQHEEKPRVGVRGGLINVK